jgi:hypothetical protein
MRRARHKLMMNAKLTLMARTNEKCFVRSRDEKE